MTNNTCRSCASVIVCNGKARCTIGKSKRVKLEDPSCDSYEREELFYPFDEEKMRKIEEEERHGGH